VPNDAWPDLEPSVAAQLDQYLDLLLAANERFNLTRIRDRADAEVFHVGDALQLLPYLPGNRPRICDLGSGGGVPGLPVAIARPDAAVTLVESVQKKAAFLQEAATELGLTNVEVVAGRAESFGGRRKFDVVLARAVAPLTRLLPVVRPMVGPIGMLLAMKGPRIEQELHDAADLLAEQRASVTTHAYELGGQMGRVIAKVTWPR
jgi:16S rRNA (guanine527-N7)-methyltransferase